METILGWTLSGKVPDSEISSCNAMLVASLFVKEMDISQLWILDSLGIQDPSEQKTKEELNGALLKNCQDLRELMGEVITKINILAASQKVFDPLGITGPVLLLPKLWLQSLWESQIGWDQEIDIKTSQDFLKWLKELEYLKHVQVPRWLHCDSGFQHISLLFCDASKLAYSAVFLRVDIGSTVHIQLVQSKTKIAPCGKKEIARLELLGAAISARLSTTVLKEFPTMFISGQTLLQY
ncbi:uncharacterized protein TNCV_3762211 [Trichonephila clavipes]|nr:uncharacterized protein TNCV_3762211 [Trichonephila clavipes]